ncbi:hypothetical protein H8356DRAFT_1402446 [Neocallimastix lanati (nom. inval.)]|uniref:G-protein coupled receptors family 1 profile domain-containing protein n=1 Tax=Neocallimastix californiae TaxID=1754190 RepID=A0A1Y2BZ63_9FUNG|nr:hypothetical protein H8356DRAFT_1402446 [Neocallimastix sp. JGI-2020a]ORY40062.1 hypothetical protein LY90DRAFT_510521 [Neocallimastix californiae]|eukprot:ORY40062.1 hypothetical protein LY90DRAFT_510521 [Neocallimastix californiae]
MNQIKLDRYSEFTGTCYGKHYENIIQGFFIQFQDSYFYANIIQFIVVSFMYVKIGNGKYWKILFYASLASFLASIIENATVAFICEESQNNKSYRVIPFLINEIFWTISQYAVPILNLIKMEALSRKRIGKVIRYTVIALGIPFFFFRLDIGYNRMMNGYLTDEKINSIHGYSCIVFAFSDLICTISILYLVKTHKKQQLFKSNVSNHIKHSSYVILITVDIVGFILSILIIVFNIKRFQNILPSYIIIPFHCIVSNLILILAVDSIVFKYCANSHHGNNSSNILSSSPRNKDIYSSNNSVKNSSNNNNKYVVEMNDVNNINSYGNKGYINFINARYGETDYNYASASTSTSASAYITPAISNSKCIVKNYLDNSFSSINNSFNAS